MTTDAHDQARAFAQAKLDDRLEPRDQAWLAAHLAGCDACRRYAAELSALESLLPATFQARWDSLRPAAPQARGLARSNPGAPVPIGGLVMTRQKLFNYAGITAGLGALLVLLVGFAFALQIAGTTDSQIPGQVVVVETQILWEQPAYQVASPVNFGEAIRLEGYSVVPDGNGGMTVELVWQALAAPPRDYMVGVFVMADGAQSAIPARSDAVPGGGLRPTSGWQPGEYVLDSHQLALAPDTDEAALDNLVLWVNVYEPETGERLPSDPAGGGPFNAVSVGRLLPNDPPLYQVASSITFGDAIQLEGYNLLPGDGFVTVELVWHALAVPPRDYVVALQLRSSQPEANVISQSDETPALGTRPTSGWQPGETISDPHTLVLPEAVAPGKYALWVSLFDPASGQAVPITAPAEGPGDAAALGTLDLPLLPQLTATPLPFPTDGTPPPCQGECTPTPTPFMRTTYTVHAGDTLEGIAAFYGVTEADLMEVNGFTDPASLFVDQVLIIPLERQVEPNIETEATTAFVATMGWTATPIGFQPSVTPCQAGCDSYWATGTAAALAGATGTPSP